ncbi:alpha-ketoacid dehydrogenase subunit beta [Amphritea balenae]|uniref:2-oxoisovalerate dehydrogenase subunit beta n=1 Tax=Amphritea balenae TaxID=452629 RepID=A0A3P1SN46_9GAMM|nr:alpha-ketoacid dehydrogenase subunit beta [Amphritea balenae]RRC98364.1 alpha-ketoacid dehydrogenase subunit beta [Amphritea balenae]GGK81297.1 2-oxoisovalerate dehydrogenase subunit beta [Amphritea balenae]
MSNSITMIEAVNLALQHEMQHDDSVVILGEDVGTNGGVFRATVGLREQFGIKRVLDTPLAETMIAGLSVGMASQGLKPVAEIQFMGFIFPTMEHMIGHAARLRHRTRGRLTCPMVLRVPFGGGIHAPEHHSESTEALFAHIPGLRVVIPSSPARAYGLLLAAIRNPDPVLFMEPKRIYRLNAQPVEDNGKALPLDRCYTLREGSDITLVSWGAMIKETLEAADQLKKRDISCEVIDVVTLNPIDHQTILASVAKTGRCVIIHEAPKSCAVGAEISATIAEQGLLSLQAPVSRVTGYDTVMPYYRMENHYMPNSADIIETVTSTLEFS